MGTPGGRREGREGGETWGEKGTMTLPCISSVATFWPAARSLLVMITFAPAAANTLTVSLPIPAFINISLDFDTKTTPDSYDSQGNQSS